MVGSVALEVGPPASFTRCVTPGWQALCASAPSSMKWNLVFSTACGKVQVARVWEMIRIMVSGTRKSRVGLLSLSACAALAGMPLMGGTLPLSWHLLASLCLRAPHSELSHHDAPADVKPCMLDCATSYMLHLALLWGPVAQSVST